MKLKVQDGTQVVADRIYAEGEVFEVPKGYEDEARRWLRFGYVTEVKSKRTRRG
jgi:hypothetical protein